MTQPILRGDVYLVDFDPPKGEEHKVGSEILKRRPAVIISHNAINRARRTVMVIPLSSSPKPIEIFAVPVPSVGPDSVAVCDQVTTINKATRLIHRIGTMSRSDFKSVETAVKEALGFSL